MMLFNTFGDVHVDNINTAMIKQNFRHGRENMKHVSWWSGAYFTNDGRTGSSTDNAISWPSSGHIYVLNDNYPLRAWYLHIFVEIYAYHYMWSMICSLIIHPAHSARWWNGNPNRLYVLYIILHSYNCGDIALCFTVFVLGHLFVFVCAQIVNGPISGQHFSM